MRQRHKIPSIFNLSMVDILCCALGCVILLWLINLREAQQQMASSGRVSEELLKTQKILDQLQLAHDSLDKRFVLALKKQEDLQTQLETTQLDLSSLTKDKIRLEKLVVLNKKEQEKLQDLLAERLKDLTTTTTDLKKKSAELITRQELIAALQKQSTDLEKQLVVMRKERDRIADANKKIPELQKKLNASSEDLRNEIARRDKLSEAIEAYQRQLASSKKSMTELETDKAKLEKQLENRQAELKTTMVRVTDLEKRLLEQARAMTNSGKQIDLLQKERDELTKERTKLQQQRVRLTAIMEQRFAGIELTGKRVIFMVDTSGSMRLLQDGVPAVDKWPKVQKALARIMRSLPDLEAFQIITFAEKPNFPLGNAGKWLKYEGNKSIDSSIAALSKIVPTGGTDLHQALQKAFDYREDGLTTIYLLSDGLPNMGEGVSDEEQQRLSQTAISNRMATYIRNKLKSEWNVVKENQAKVRIHGVGFFFESPDVGAFLWALARENDGSFVGMSKP